MRAIGGAVRRGTLAKINLNEELVLPWGRSADTFKGLQTTAPPEAPRDEGLEGGGLPSIMLLMHGELAGTKDEALVWSAPPHKG
jgi:hypothetical protein